MGRTKARNHMKLNVGRNSLAIMTHAMKISRPASFRRAVLGFRESIRVTSELPTFSSTVCNKNVNAVQDLRFPQRFYRGFWSLMLYRWVSVSRSFEEIIIIFINCNWVVTRWQWLFYMYTEHEIGYY